MSKAHERVVEAQFGPRAKAYVESAVHSQGADLEAIGALAQQQRPELALDMGAGGGHVAYALARHARRVIATDLSSEMLAAVARTARREGVEQHRDCRSPSRAAPLRGRDVRLCRQPILRASLARLRRRASGSAPHIETRRPSGVRRRLCSGPGAVRHASAGDRIAARPFSRPRLHERAMAGHARPLRLRHRGLPDVAASDGFPCLDCAHANVRKTM